MPRIRRLQYPTPPEVPPDRWAKQLRARAGVRAARRALGAEEWEVWDDPPPVRQGPLIYCKDIGAYRSAWETSQKRAAEWAAWKADPEAQAVNRKAMDEIASASVPWKVEGYKPTPIPDEAGRKRRMQKTFSIGEMRRIEHDTIPLEEEEIIRRLVKKYRLSPVLPPPPKPRIGKTPMGKPTKWDTVDERPVDFDTPQKGRPSGKFIPWWYDLWVWHEGKAIVLKADVHGDRMLRRLVINSVPTKKKMQELKTELERRLKGDGPIDLEALVEEIVPVDPSTSPAPRRTAKSKSHFKSLKEARKKLERASDGIRSEGFEAWIERYVKPAERPDEWTRAAVLYENYVKHVRRWGNSRHDKRLSELEMATETRFGIMLREIGVMKKRRRGGYYYPLQIKQGA